MLKLDDRTSVTDAPIPIACLFVPLFFSLAIFFTLGTVGISVKMSLVEVWAVTRDVASQTSFLM